MTERYPAVLGVAERVVKGLLVLNAIYGVAILILLIASIAAPALTLTALSGGAAKPNAGVLRAMQGLMVVGIVSVPATQLLLVRLRDMLSTVRTGDPFIADNARRLDAIAFGVLGLEVLRLLAGAIVSNSALLGLGVRIRAGFAFTPWVAVLLLFVLARVFEHGAHMRADLEGTV